MSNTKNLANLAAALDDGTSGQVLQSTGSGGVQFADSSGSGVTVHANQAAMLTDAASSDEGTLHYETGTNKLYVKQTSGFYLLASITNSSPTINSFSENTGGAGANNLTTGGTFTLTSGSNTVVTINATDPDLETIVYSATVTSGTATDVFSSPSFPVSNQSSNVFTLTPVTSGSGGTVTIRFDASDGTNVANVSHSFEIAFIITDSHYTSLLVATDGSAGANSTITYDTGSTSDNSFTVNGDPYAGTFSPYRHGGYSVYFDGTGDSLTTTSTDYNLGTSSAFTVEFWYYFDESRTHTVFDFYNSSAVQSAKLAFTSTNVYLYDGTANILALTRTQNVGVWEHFCWTRDASNNHTFYINGSQVGTSTATTSIDAYTIDLGRRAGSFNSTFMKGYISDFRLVKGTPITPSSGGPTERLTSVSGTGYSTSLLTCHLPYIADGSSNEHSITVSGNTSTKPFGPYDYQQYSASNNGGSVYFDGTGDFLTAGSSGIINFGTGDLTVEFWINTTAGTGANGVNILNPSTSTGSGYWAVILQNGNLRWNNSYNVSNLWEVDVSNELDGSWHHMSIVRSSGTFSVYVDGTSKSAASGTFTDSTNYSGDEAVRIGQGNANDFTGYLSDVRIVKGTAVYTGNFTPPSGPLTTTGGTYPSTTNVNTSITASNTSLLLKGTDAHVIDKSQGNNLKLVGNTAASTTQAKFSNTASVYFDGAGDHIEIDGPFNLGTQPWTWETWIYTADSTYTLINIGESITTGTSIERAGTSFYIYDLAANTYYSFSGVPADNTWTHLAFCRQSNGNHDFYKDGTRISNYTSWNSKDWGSLAKLKIGEYWTTNQSDFNGYFQDMRLTLGKSRYTAADESSNIPSSPLKG